MGNPKMVILPGNAAKEGKYPDEQGNTPAWPKGALHVKAASDYAMREGFDPSWLTRGAIRRARTVRKPRRPWRCFMKDELDVAFYGFSGGGYNLRHILEYLAAKEPQSLRRIKRVVVLGAPFKERAKMFAPARYNALVNEKAKGQGWQKPDWVVVYRENPTASQLPKGPGRKAPSRTCSVRMFCSRVGLSSALSRKVKTVFGQEHAQTNKLRARRCGAAGVLSAARTDQPVRSRPSPATAAGTMWTLLT